MADGSECPVPASHFWGPVKMCCTHFEEFTAGLIDTAKLPQKPRHIDIVEEYNRQRRKADETFTTSLIPGTKCEGNAS
jgi:hypothetical protein